MGVLHDQGGDGTTYDLDIRLADAKLGAVEVTTVTEPWLLRFWHERGRSGPVVSVQGLSRRWFAWPDEATCFPPGVPPERAYAQLRRAIAGHAGAALRALETGGVFSFDAHRADGWEVRTLGSLGLAGGFARAVDTDVPGDIAIMGPASAGFISSSRVVDAALDELGRNSKLRTVAAAERHFFVWIDGFSAGLIEMGMDDGRLPDQTPNLGPGITAIWIAGRPAQANVVVWRYDIRVGGWERFEVSTELVLSP